MKPRAALGPGLALVTNPRLLNPAFAAGASGTSPSPTTARASATPRSPARDPDRPQPALPGRDQDDPAAQRVRRSHLRHTADFGGNVDEVAYAWWYREEDGRTKPGQHPGGLAGAPLWEAAAAFSSADGRPGLVQVELNGDPTLLLADNLFSSLPLSSLPNTRYMCS